MDRQAAPASGTGHALVDLAGVAKLKFHANNCVYHDDDSIRFH